MTVHRRAALAPGLPCLLLFTLVAACGGDSGAVPASVRRGPFGSLRDLVLYQRAGSEPFFLDRFEVTQGDWAQWLAASGRRPSGIVRSAWGGERPASDQMERPMAHVSLAEARSFAKWRLCRVPRWDEWAHAATGRGQYPYPWGARWSWSRANTAEFGLFEPTLVGTFERGRQGDGPYDLVGNVSEWSESIPVAWYLPAEEGLVSRHPVQVARLRAHPAVRPWLLGATPVPSVLTQLGGVADAPRLVLGADFASAGKVDSDKPTQPLGRQARDRSDRTGLRLAVTPRELLRRLLEYDRPLAVEDRANVRAFFSGAGHRAVMAATWDAGALPPGVQQSGGASAQLVRESIQR